ncbi:hypothetical protein ENSA5_28670 [Enhygromyxa salina]|uniref:Glycosyltransferase RgtA/B/C/D-like domain-containing protein n=1 Tax=Enhygromyxa salina TaxID=215803 RepID=A0A2S9Y454_9BACT|nr:hypothetical protein [Enhygromyxa salina]PRP99879.1 hypothetical protein ENSA5_28670 [Enhygromyxa salina]
MSRDAERNQGRGERRGDVVRRLGLPLLLALLTFVWLANSSGLVSSNDGSHLALARALVLRGETTIDPDRALALEVDLAERDGHAYSDRPPGTAFAALASVWIGARLDPAMLERAKQQARAHQDVEPLPAAPPYISTYAKRTTGAGRASGPALAGLIGTSLAISCHAALVGLVGLMFIDALLRRLAPADAPADGQRLVVLACLGLASAWGPYASALFAHVSAATAVAGFLWGVVTLAQRDSSSRGRAGGLGWVAALTGLAGAWAIACDYLLLVAIVPASLVAIDRRRWLAVVLGTTPVVVATLAYHHAAFGGVFSVGYDHQSNFEFARGRASTFSGSLFEGLWTLWGLGRGAGLLAQAPIVLVALIALPALARRDVSPGSAAIQRALLGFVPWALVLAMHRTPWGGGTEDHRYLIPILPFAALGLALAWARANTALRVGLAGLAGLSAILVWRHFLAWHETPAFDRPAFGAGAAAVVLLAALLATHLRQKVPSA